ncbi:MAG: VapC toxin family PIN domain ribonuclease [Betaproteobacteria bacterium]|nr:VapC toxin family PIN domain ribonuclease [Betaproteobacteria bacterium]
MPVARETSAAYRRALAQAERRIGLLDKNVLIALCDGRHEHHDLAAHWFLEHAAQGWASCPLTQNGALRIMSAPAYPGARPVAQVLAQLQTLCASPHHHFWPDALSLVQADILNPRYVLSHRQLTDAYLLALAVHQQGCLVTLDGAVALQSVRGAEPGHLLRLLR